jgi:hypothetical protein
MKLVKAMSETSSWLPFWIYIIVVEKQRKKKRNLQWYSDLGTGSSRYSVTAEQCTYISLLWFHWKDNNLDTTNLTQFCQHKNKML